MNALIAIFLAVYSVLGLIVIGVAVWLITNYRFEIEERDEEQ